MNSTTAPTPPVPGPAVESRLPAWWRSPAILPAIALVATGAILGFDSLGALALVVFEGNLVLAILVAAGLAGGWLVPIIGLGRQPWRDRVLVGAGLGVGGLSLIVLGLGCAGLLNRVSTMALLGGLALAALLRVGADLHRMLLQQKHSAAAGGPSRSARHEAVALVPSHYLWLLACPFLAIAAAAAVMPPGILWAEEAGGYDVLEYHLAVPKEFFEAGRIFFMPYNVYSNMPSNSEMLSLLMMHLRGDAVDATFLAQLNNVALAALFVAAAWWAGRLYSRQAGIAAGVLAATTPWISYLAGIAFVEVGMLAMGMLALGAMLRAMQPDATARTAWSIAAGLLAGLACGFKYTAVPLIALPLGLLALFASASFRQRLTMLAAVALAALVTFSPWLIRNVINTGNPVFPLAYSVFGAREGTWDAELDARWRQAHGWAGSSLNERESTIIAALDRTIGDDRFGLGLTLLAIIGAVRRRPWGLLVLLIVQVAVWYTFTHLFARFAVILLLPTLVLAARAFEDARPRILGGLCTALIVVGAGWNLYHLGTLYYHHTRELSTGRPYAAHGHVNWFVQGKWPGCEYLTIVNALDKNSRVMFVGEARTFYVETPHEYATAFNHHPLAQAVQRLMPDAVSSAPVASSAPERESAAPADAEARAVVKYLADRGITHVLVNWSELQRLQATYGIEKGLHPEVFRRMEAAGLAHMGDFMFEEGMPAYATLYEVTHE